MMSLPASVLSIAYLATARLDAPGVRNSPPAVALKCVSTGPGHSALTVTGTRFDNYKLTKAYGFS